jgi:hypothetical protein
MTGEIWSADKAKLETVRGHLFDIEDHINRAEEALQAMAGLVDIENAARYKAALNCVVDDLHKEIKNVRQSWEPAFELVREAAPSLTDKVEAGLNRAEQGCDTLEQHLED